MKNLTGNYLDVMENIAKKNAKTITESLEETLYNAMTSLNVGMVSFVLNGDNSNFDVPRAYATMEDDIDATGNEYCVREIIAVLVRNGHIYIIPDTPNVTDELLDELQCWTHFTPRDVAKLKDLDNAWVAIRATDNYNLINRNDMMLNIFKSCNEALMDILTPLERTINISER